MIFVATARFGFLCWLFGRGQDKIAYLMASDTRNICLGPLFILYMFRRCLQALIVECRQE